MKIAILNSFYYPDEPGGAERSVRILAEALAAAGHAVSVICLGRQSAETEVNGVAVLRLPIRNSYLPSALGGDRGAVQRLIWHARDTHNAAAAADVAALLRRLRPDVLHTNNLSGFSVAVWPVARTLGIRTVHTIRDFYLMCPRTTMMRGDVPCEGICRSCAAFALGRRRATAQVDHLVAISQFMLDRHRRSGYFRQIPSSVIYNPYDRPEQIVQPVVDRSGTTLGYLGRLAPSKGVELLLEAFAQIHRRHPTTRLLIAGSGADDYVAELRRRAQRAPVEFLGHVPPERFFPQIDITVVPSIWNEPLGRVVIESFAFGRPVVATPMGGIPELVRGEAGTLARSTTVADLARAIDAQLAQDAILAGAAAVGQAQRFASRTLVDAYCNVFRGAEVDATC